MMMMMRRPLYESEASGSILSVGIFVFSRFFRVKRSFCASNRIIQTIRRMFFPFCYDSFHSNTSYPMPGALIVSKCEQLKFGEES